MAKASIAINSSANDAMTELSDDAVSLFFETLAEVGMTEKEAAYTMRLDPAQLSRVKTRQARLPFDAMWHLPNAFWFAFRCQIDLAKNLNEQNLKAVRAARIAELVKLLIEEAVA